MTARSTKNGPLLGTYIFRQCLAVFCLLSSLGGKQSSLSLVSAQSCIDNFYEIYEKEALVTDTTFNRLYIICPRRIYEIATLDFNGNIREPQSSGVFPPLPLRSNITIRCGDQGSREDLCWLTGGDLHMDGTNVLGLAEETIENVSIEGFVFIGARKHSLWAAKPGSIFFRDCEWKVCGWFCLFLSLLCSLNITNNRVFPLQILMLSIRCWHTNVRVRSCS